MMKRIIAFAFCAVLELSFLMAQDYTRYVDPHIGSDLSVEKGKGNVAKFIHHHLLISGGKLVLPSFLDREKMVDKHGNTLENSGKEKSTAFPPVVNNLWKTIPTQCIAHFVLNRQYRNWEVGVDSSATSTTTRGCKTARSCESPPALRCRGCWACRGIPWVSTGRWTFAPSSGRFGP